MRAWQLDDFGLGNPVLTEPASGEIVAAVGR